MKAAMFFGTGQTDNKGYIKKKTKINKYNQ